MLNQVQHDAMYNDRGVPLCCSWEDDLDVNKAPKKREAGRREPPGFRGEPPDLS